MALYLQQCHVSFDFFILGVFWGGYKTDDASGRRQFNPTTVTILRKDGKNTKIPVDFILQDTQLVPSTAFVTYLLLSLVALSN